MQVQSQFSVISLLRLSIYRIFHFLHGKILTICYDDLCKPLIFQRKRGIAYDEKTF